MRKYFDEELLKLNRDLVKMSTLVEESIENMLLCLKSKDLELSEELIKKDKYINEYERRIETSCFHLLLTQQPLASDLRHITSILKLVTDLERIADQATDIIEIIIETKNLYDYNDVENLYFMAKSAKKMVRYSIDAFIAQDIGMAKEVFVMEEDVNLYFDDIKIMVQNHIRANSSDIDRLTDLLMIAKHLEKIGDHAVNVCEWLEFEEKGIL